MLTALICAIAPMIVTIVIDMLAGFWGDFNANQASVLNQLVTKAPSWLLSPNMVVILLWQSANHISFNSFCVIFFQPLNFRSKVFAHYNMLLMILVNFQS
jgi:hypothetical protein